jgi:hypothetical protein
LAGQIGHAELGLRDILRREEAALFGFAAANMASGRKISLYTGN